jgi:hypothetical protein
MGAIEGEGVGVVNDPDVGAEVGFVLGSVLAVGALEDLRVDAVTVVDVSGHHRPARGLVVAVDALHHLPSTDPVLRPGFSIVWKCNRKVSPIEKKVQRIIYKLMTAVILLIY